MRYGSDRARRQCESLGIDGDEAAFKAAVFDIDWSKNHGAHDQRAGFLHPCPNGREAWRVRMSGTEVDVEFVPEASAILAVSTVRGYAHVFAKTAPVRALEVAVPCWPPPVPRPAAPSKPIPPRRPPTANSWDWTPERKAVLAEMWPTYASRYEIDAKLRALPGKAGALDVIAIYASATMHLKRPTDFAQVTKPANATRETRAEREARIGARNAIICEGCAAGLDDADILVRIKAAETGPWGGRLTIGDVAGIARTLGYKRLTVEAVVPGLEPQPDIIDDAPEIVVEPTAAAPGDSPDATPAIDLSDTIGQLPAPMSIPSPMPEAKENGHAASEPPPVHPGHIDISQDALLQMMLDEERWLEARLVGLRVSIRLYRGDGPPHHLDEAVSAGPLSSG